MGTATAMTFGLPVGAANLPDNAPDERALGAGDFDVRAAAVVVPSALAVVDRAAGAFTELLDF